MDLDRRLLAMIEEYISEAMMATGTRRAPRGTWPERVFEPDPDPADLEPQTEPFGTAFEDEYESYEASGGAFVIDEGNADAALLAQVTQQLSSSESAIEPLSRARAPRSTADLDEEVTSVLQRPPAKT
jgi:hypothetical protein